MQTLSSNQLPLLATAALKEQALRAATTRAESTRFPDGRVHTHQHYRLVDVNWRRLRCPRHRRACPDPGAAPPKLGSAEETPAPAKNRKGLGGRKGGRRDAWDGGMRAGSPALAGSNTHTDTGDETLSHLIRHGHTIGHQPRGRHESAMRPNSLNEPKRAQHEF